MANYDALLLLSFGGPEGPDEVMPFLENVVQGKPVPRRRLEQVAEHYALFDGVSPINAQNRALLHALITELNTDGPPLPVYWGNRHWHPMLADVVAQMAEDGIRRALCFVTSAFSSYPGCRQYLEAIADARAARGDDAPAIDKIRVFYNHPGFIEAVSAQLNEALGVASGGPSGDARVVFTAHSLPLSMAQTCDYERQLREACRLVAERGGVESWELAYQSRSGPPDQPWLEPDVLDVAERLADQGNGPMVVVPIGFINEHMEVAYDLDIELARRCDELGVAMIRAGVSGSHPRFVRMIRELVVERLDEQSPRPALGSDGPAPDICPADCCPPPARG